MILGVCTDLLAFALQLRKTSARRPSDEGAVQPVIVSNWVPVGSHITSGREKGGNKERTGWVVADHYYY